MQLFVEESIDPSAQVHTDGSWAYGFLEEAGYVHQRTVVKRGGKMVASLSVVNRVASLLKRRLLGTHHGAAQPRQLDHYLEEFAFRFNRRTPRARGLLLYGLLEQAARQEPARTGMSYIRAAISRSHLNWSRADTSGAETGVVTKLLDKSLETREENL